jgi:HEAT repeat protein
MPSYRKYRRVLVGASIVALGLLLAILFYRPAPEPSWKGRPVSAWVKELRVFGSDAEVVAEEAILHLGPQAAPCLTATLRKSDTLFSDFWFSNYPRLPAWVRKKIAAPRARWEARADAAHGLELLGPAASKSMRWLVAAMDDKNKWVRSGAAAAVGSMGAAGTAASERLVAGLNDPDPNFRLACLIALRRLNGCSTESLDAVFLTPLKDPDPNFRAIAAEGLGKSSGGSPAVQAALIAALHDPSTTVVDRAATALAHKSGWGQKVTPELLLALAETEQKAMTNNSGSMIAMWKILRAFAELGPAAKSAIPALTNRLKSSIPIVGTLSAIAWVNIETNSPAALQALVSRLDESNWNDQFWAIWALGKLGPRSESAVPRLKALAEGRTDLSEQTERKLQIMIVAALWRIDANEPNPTTRILDLVGPKLRRNGDYETVRLLGEIGPVAAGAVPLLLEGYKSSGGSMLREYCMEALEKIDPETARNPWR